MKLYVANVTRQNIDFIYRVPESSGTRTQTIPVGCQIPIAQDLTKEAIDYIIEQHGRYGMIEVSEIDRGRDFCSTCYSVDKPVPGSKIEWLMRHNQSVLIERGRETRRNAAVMGNNLLEQQMDDAGPQAPAVRSYEVTMVEENHDDRDEQPAVAEAIRVSRGEDAPPPPTRATSRRRRP